MADDILIRVIDFETSGEEPAISIVEAGWCDIRISGDRVTVGEPRSTLVRPAPTPPDTFEMSISARGIHHIDPRLLITAPVFSDVSPMLTDPVPLAFAAHYAEYEKSLFRVAFGGAEIPWIDTYKVSLRLPYSLPDHKNQTLRYFHGHDDKIPGFTALAMPPHRAGPDAFVTAHNLAQDLKFANVQTMIAWSQEPAFMPLITFGTKARGKPWSDADLDYLVWIVNKSELDADTKWNAQREIDRRASVLRQDYVRDAGPVIAKITTVDGLTEWFRDEAPKRFELEIIKGSEEYAKIAATCAERKAFIMSSRPLGASIP